MISLTRKRRGCAFGSVLELLPESDRAALVAQLALPLGDPRRLSYAALSDVLLSEGFRVHYKTIEQHRKGLCRCEPVG